MAGGAIKLLVIVMLLAVPGCAANRTTWGKAIVERAYCGADGEAGLYRPVELSRQDTDGTIEQTLVNNKVYADTCG